MTTDIKELIAVGRKYADGVDKDRGFESGLTDCLRGLSDALEALAGEVERLTIEAKTATTLLEAEKWSRAHVKSIIVSDLEAERDRLAGEVERWRNNSDNGDVQIADLKAERDRLKAALEEIDAVAVDFGYYEAAARTMKELALKALRAAGDGR